VLIAPGGAGRALLDEFRRLEPFGPGAPEPLFAAASVQVVEAMALRGGHIRCVLADGAGARLRAVAWRAGDTELGRRLLARDGTLHVAGRLKPDDWKGRNDVQLEIEDAADPRMCG
jgi:single-stranded-DNA-specific exonuclease